MRVTNQGTPPITARQVTGRLPILIAVTGALVGTVYGYDQGSIASALLFLRPAFRLSTFMTTVVTAAVSVGTLFGALAGGRIANAIGRKRAMLVIAVGYALFSGLQATATGAWMLATIRFLLGIVIGISIVAAPAFIAESAPARIRGRMLVTFQIATSTGIVVAYLVGLALTPSQNWRLILGLAAVPAVVVLLFLWRLPDTPRWYLMKGRREMALSVLRRTDRTADPETQARMIEEDMATTSRGSYAQLFRRPLRRAGVFVIGLGLAVQISGINAIVYYSPTILKTVGFRSATQAILAATLLQVASLAAEICAFSLVDRLGRRPVLLTGISLMAAANLILVSAFFYGPSAVLAIAGIFLFLVGFGFGYGSLVWVYVAESLPAQMRSIGGSALLTADLFGNIIIGFFFLNAMAAIGGAATFGIFLALSVVAFVFVAVLAPETKGRPLEDIRSFWANRGHWPAARPVVGQPESHSTR